MLKFVLLIACIVLLIKWRGVATALMLAGMVLSVSFVVLRFLMSIASAKNSPEALIRNQEIFSMLNNLPHVLFGIGLLFLVFKGSHLRNKN